MHLPYHAQVFQPVVCRAVEEFIVARYDVHSGEGAALAIGRIDARTGFGGRISDGYFGLVVRLRGERDAGHLGMVNTGAFDVGPRRRGWAGAVLALVRRGGHVGD